MTQEMRTVRNQYHLNDTYSYRGSDECPFQIACASGAPASFGLKGSLPKRVSGLITPPRVAA